MTAPDDADLSATLAPIKERAGVLAKLGPPRPAQGFGSETCNAAIASAGDVPGLVAFAEAVLKLADEWDAESDARDDESERPGADEEGALVLRGQAITYHECAGELREAVTATLTREEAGNA